MIIDSHCHLDYSILYNQLDDVIKRAEKNDVKLFLTICTTLKSFEKIKLIIKKYKNIFGTFGIHPHETKSFSSIDCKYIINKVREDSKIIGIGETGLDFYYNHSEKKIQKVIFAEHIKAAIELNKPIIVHSRNAEKDIVDILKNESKNSNLKILIHCFSGSKEYAKKLIDLDCYISFSGIITFNNTAELTEIAKFIPIEKLLVETDSPYLSPVPYRGKTNEPSHIIHTINKLSEIKDLSKEMIVTNSTLNFKKIFKIS